MLRVIDTETCGLQGELLKSRLLTWWMEKLLTL